MKIFKNIALMFAVLGCVTACEPELESEGLALGTIRFPSINLNGDQFETVVAGGSYTDPGARALLGQDDISDQLVTEGTVDINTPGVYLINYSVSTVNDLDEQSVATATRYVAVTSVDVADTDLSGDYEGEGFATNPLVVSVEKIGTGWYTIEDVLSSANGITATFAHLGGDVIQIPSQVTGFGEVNTTSEGSEATLTPVGFSWSVFIGCCGVFGPIEFTKQ